MSSGGGSPWLSAPTWTVDAGRFRDTCDRLRAALAAPVMPRSDAAGQALGHDRAAIATSLRDVLAAVDGVDLEAVRARSSMVKEFRSTEHAQRLGGLMSTLEGALQRYVASVLGPTKTRVIKRLLGSPAPDVLRILGREDHENSHSDLIAWLLSPRRAPVVALHALRRLTSRMGNAGRWAEVLADAVADEAVSVRREFVLHGRDAVEQRRIDIVVSGPRFILAIENKVWASEHTDQTAAYWTWLDELGGPELRGGIFLSPDGRVATAREFLAVSYLDLVDALIEGPSRASITQAEEIVLASYLKTLARGVIPVEMRAAVASCPSEES